MHYPHRRLENQILSVAQHFKVILLLGARQTGKSTLLKHLMPHATFMIFDPVQDMYDARKDPDQRLNLYQLSQITLSLASVKAPAVRRS